MLCGPCSLPAESEARITGKLGKVRNPADRDKEVAYARMEKDGKGVKAAQLVPTTQIVLPVLARDAPATFVVGEHWPEGATASDILAPKIALATNCYDYKDLVLNTNPAITFGKPLR